MIQKMCLLLCFVPVLAFSTTIPTYNMAQFNKTVQRLYATVPASHSRSVATRVAAASSFFLGKPYVLGALGEGPKGKFDQSPLYRTNAFDCVTFVSTVVAVVESNNLQQFQHNIIKIRYNNAQISYLNRNHFMSVDWNPNNTLNGYVKDITYRLVDKAGKPVAKVAVTNINKPDWYKNLTSNAIKSLRALSNKQIKSLVKQLRQLSAKTQQEKSVILYVPLTKLFVHGKPNKFLFAQIPSGSIIEIVRPNWDLRAQIGTYMNVSHLGLAVRTNKGLMYREASSLQHKVIDTPLAAYLGKYVSSKTVKGINVEQIV